MTDGVRKHEENETDRNKTDAGSDNWVFDPNWPDIVDVTREIFKDVTKEQWLESYSKMLSILGEQRHKVMERISRMTGKGNEEPIPDEDWVFDPNAPSIEELITESVKKVPESDWRSVPTDLSERHDFYLYGIARE